jgi:hypothetical protein
MSKCESCGRQWIDREGIIRTCKRNGDQAVEIAKLKAEIERLHKIERERYTGWAKALFDTKQKLSVPPEF